MLSRDATLERERRWRVPAAISAILVPILFVPQSLLSQRLFGTFTGFIGDSLPYVDANSGLLALAQAARGLAFLAMIPALIYLYFAAAARSDRVSKPLAVFAVIGPALFAVQAALGLVAQLEIADSYVAASARGGDVFGLFRDLTTDTTMLTTAQTVLLPAQLALMVAFIYTPLQAMRNGLLTRFSATFAMALGAGSILLQFFRVPPDVPILFISFWMLFLGLLILGVAVRRPPAWDAGVAIPWPKPGEPARPAEEPARPEEFVDAEAEETTGRGEPAVNPNAARRERAKRKRRKQRRG